MSYTDKFLRLPVEMYNKKEAELTGDNDSSSFDSFGKFNPMEISSYIPAYDNDSKLIKKTTVYFRGGESILVLMDLPSFEKVVNEFMSKQ
jgi:hypothetical protein